MVVVVVVVVVLVLLLPLLVPTLRPTRTSRHRMPRGSTCAISVTKPSASTARSSGTSTNTQVNGRTSVSSVRRRSSTSTT
uniref:Putative secreted protein n=1 Tax=Anopheles darlingi TaxID=43151 RepID=A0A2M4D3I7_ANODA